jgi:hypothetical protein
MSDLVWSFKCLTQCWPFPLGATDLVNEIGKVHEHQEHQVGQLV